MLKWYLRKMAGFCLFFILSLDARPLSAQPLANEARPPVDVQLEVSQPGPDTKVVILLVTVRNRSLSDAAEAISVRLKHGDSEEEKTIKLLKSGQSCAEKFDLPSSCSNPCVFVSYKWKNQENSLARAVLLPTATKIDNIMPILIPVLASLVGTILGAWLVQYFTSNREQARAKFDWSKMLFERYEKSYRDFLSNWADSPIAIILQKNYDLLRSNCFVPANVVDAATNTLAVLSDKNSTDVDKKEACILLRQSIETYMTKPW